MTGKAFLKTYKRQMIIATSIIVLIAIVVTAGIVGSLSRQHKGALEQQTAYANILKDSLSVYHARYGKYPNTYQVLLGDIDKTRDVYGVNDEGFSELSDINSKLADFTYTRESKSDGYMFSFDNLTGSKITVKSE